MSLRRAPENAFRDLSSHASFFRTKLIHEFNLLDNLNDMSFTTPPATMTSKDFQEQKVRFKILNDAPISLIKFPQIKRKQNDDSIKKIDRRLTRTKNMDSIPIGAWAAWLLNLPAYKNTIVVFIAINAACLGIMTELWTIESQVWAGFQALIIVNQICLAAFYIDIFIKWIDDFSSYWKDGWNIADAVITGIVSVPEVISWTKIFPHLSDQNDFFTAIRVLSVFKLIMRFETFKIIIMTIIQAVNSMGSIMLFVFMVVLTYSVIGTSFYSDYTHSVRADLFYQDFFSNVKATLTTLFQLLTLDQWDVINRNLRLVSNSIYSEGFIVSWVFLGAFIFRNIFVGVMVHNFDRISDTLRAEKMSQIKQKRLERMRKRLKNELAVHGNIQAMTDHKAIPHDREDVSSMTSNPTGHDHERHMDVLRNMQRLMVASHDVSLAWDATVQETLASLALDQHDETLWPRDSLFKYLQLMETLMESMKEYQELNLLASKQLMELFDT